MARIDRHADIKIILETWAMWRVQGLSGLSYPSSSIEARMMEYGGASGSVPGPRVIRYMPHIVCSEVDKVVGEWPKIGGQWARRYLVLWTHYVGKEGKGMELEAKVICSGCKSERTFWRTLEKVHDVLDAQIIRRKKIA